MVYQPQSDVQVIIIPVDGHLETSPTEVEATLLVCPEGSDTQLELLSVGFRANTLPGDSSDVTVNIEFIDDSAGDGVTTIGAGTHNLKSGDALVNNELYRGNQILDPGDAINAEITTDGLDIPAQGACFVVEFRMKRHA